MPTTIAYITGCAHSGTTLLHRVLGAHPEVVSAGGLKHLGAAVCGAKTCSCGASLRRCGFWRAVDEALRERGRDLASLDLKARDPRVFADDNRALLGALSSVTGARVIADSSRDPTRLLRLGRVEGVRVVALYLFKDPRAQLSSYRRKGDGLAVGLARYYRHSAATLAATMRTEERMLLSYERFCSDPAETLHGVLGRLRLDDDEALLGGWGSQPVHALGGNRMLRSASSEITLDASWRTRLGPREQTAAYWLGGPMLWASKAALAGASRRWG